MSKENILGREDIARGKAKWGINCSRFIQGKLSRKID